MNVIRLRTRYAVKCEQDARSRQERVWTVAGSVLAALFIGLAIFALNGCTTYAQTNSVPSVPGVKGEATSLLLAVIPLLVPLIVALAKSVIKFLPSWSLPILAAALGELLNFISGLLGGPSTTLIGGVVLGAAGTGLREIVDQLKNRGKDDV